MPGVQPTSISAPSTPRPIDIREQLLTNNAGKEVLAAFEQFVTEKNFNPGQPIPEADMPDLLAILESAAPKPVIAPPPPAEVVQDTSPRDVQGQSDLSNPLLSEESKEIMAKINDPSKAFRKDTPDGIRKKAEDKNLSLKEAQMWATTTTKEGRALLGISGRMDASERAILVKQYYARKADGGKNAEKDTETDGKTEGTFKKSARTATNIVSAPVRWLMKGAGSVAGLFSQGAKTKLNSWADGLKWVRPTAEEAPAMEQVPEATDVADSPQAFESSSPEVVDAEEVPETPPQVKTRRLPPLSYEIAQGDTYLKIARQNLIGNDLANPTETQISKRARQILDANPGVAPEKLKIGSKINMPAYNAAELEKAPELLSEKPAVAAPASAPATDTSEEKAVILETVNKAKLMVEDIYRGLLPNKDTYKEDTEEINQKLVNSQERISIAKEFLNKDDEVKACIFANRALMFAEEAKVLFEKLTPKSKAE